MNNISISNGAAFHHNGGVIVHSNLLTLAGGTWQARPGEQAFGRMLLGKDSGESGSTNVLDAGGCVERFAESSGVAWWPEATLTILNWNGSPSGGGKRTGQVASMRPTPIRSSRCVRSMLRQAINFILMSAGSDVT